jgi:hypothetical protein
VRQLHLHLAQLPLAAGDLQCNGRLRSEVCDQFDLFLRKGLYALSPKRERSDYLVVFWALERGGASVGPF